MIFAKKRSILQRVPDTFRVATHPRSADVRHMQPRISTPRPFATPTSAFNDLCAEFRPAFRPFCPPVRCGPPPFFDHPATHVDDMT